MGIKDLWGLIAPCGSRIALETVATRRLAVDASIWLTQFIRAMTDDNGEPIPGSHLIGMFNRLCMLLVFGIRPVIVFDGPAPALKKRTLQQRAKSRKEARSTATLVRLVLLFIVDFSIYVCACVFFSCILIYMCLHVFTCLYYLL